MRDNLVPPFFSRDSDVFYLLLFVPRFFSVELCKDFSLSLERVRTLGRLLERVPSVTVLPLPLVIMTSAYWLRSDAPRALLVLLSFLTDASFL